METTQPQSKPVPYLKRPIGELTGDEVRKVVQSGVVNGVLLAGLVLILVAFFVGLIVSLIQQGVR